MNVFHYLFLTSLGWTTSESFATTGCYSTKPQDKDDMVLAYQADNRLTVSECSRKCQMNTKAYSGILEASSCFCGDEFGHTPPMTDCNYTCSDKLSCGGLTSYNTYYVIDENASSRKYAFFSDAKSFYEARRSCVKLGGDLAGRTMKNERDNISLEVRNSSSSATSVWIGLRKRDVEYEWVDEKDPNQDDTYAKEKYLFQNQWSTNDPQLKCVSYGVDTRLLASKNCSEHLPFVCYLPPYNTGLEETTSEPSSQLRESSDPEESSRRLALLIVLPLFFICYGGACILYCIHQIVKHCCGQTYRHTKLKSSSRPSSGKKSTVYPEAVVTDPSQSKLVPPLVPYPDKTPYMADPLADEKKAKLLENASREARERRMKEAEEGKASRIFSGQKKPPEPPPAVDHPEISRSTSKLLPPPATSQDEKPPQQEQDQEPAQSMAGKSINEILRLKMAQQANKKRPKKILAA